MPSSALASAWTRAAACSISSTSSEGCPPATGRMPWPSLTSQPLPVVGEVDVPGLLADAQALSVQHDHGHLVQLVAVVGAQVRQLLQRERRVGGGERMVVAE